MGRIGILSLFAGTIVSARVVDDDDSVCKVVNNPEFIGAEGVECQVAARVSK